ncbi:hypothetical protein GALMADRAFT_249819 [Galerina marginata CBS 339.88]|uniref:Uncharacterized protein n=1 Tax=Galerina marginata (strain CBS 339.88) TaxID=685588 RepID=A0A067SVJ1_GALM3|nr:hypothetical protein GALMADRAFT_249819 [Galerina marginata CBS 339.88]
MGLKFNESRPKASIVDGLMTKAVELLGPFLPTAPVNGSVDVIKAFILPGSKTGVMFVGSFSSINSKPTS